MKKWWIAGLTLLLALVVLAGCQSTPAAIVAPAEIDLASLPTTIDVQTADALRQRDDVVLIDVREQWEYDEAHIPGVTLVPLGELANRVNEIPRDKTVVLTCRSGNRSGQALQFLQQQGFNQVHNMAGGILAWQRAGLPVE